MTNRSIKEEIGRNYHTLDPDPYTWKDYSNVEVETYVNDDAGWSAKVTCLSDDSLSTPLRKFEDEASAMFWAQQQSDRIMRKTINESRVICCSLSCLRRSVRRILLEAYKH